MKNGYLITWNYSDEIHYAMLDDEVLFNEIVNQEEYASNNALHVEDVIGEKRFAEWHNQLKTGLFTQSGNSENWSFSEYSIKKVYQSQFFGV